MDTAVPLLQMVISLGAVVAAILGLAWLSRRMQGLRARSGGDDLQIRAALAVGMKERVVIIQTRGQEFLVGVAPGRVNLLTSLGSAQPPADATDPQTVTEPPRFAEALAQQLRQAFKR